MKPALIITSIFFSFYTFAQNVYTFDCASDEGYLLVRVEADKFNSQLKYAPGEIEIHSDNGSEVFSNALISNRLLNNDSFRFSVGMGRARTASMKGNYLDQSGSFSVKTSKNSMSASDAVCRFNNGTEIEE